MKHFLKVVGAGVCIGILLTMVQIILRVDRDVFMRGYWIVGAAVVIGTALFNILYIGRYRRKMRGAITLFEKGEIKAYLDEVEEMLWHAKGRNLRNTLKIDLSVGYYEMGEYGRAIDILEEMSHEPMRGGVKMVYRLNLSLYYFHTSQNSRAMELYNAGEKEFARYRNSRYYGGNIALLDMLAAIEDGRHAEAEELLARARQTWDRPRLQKEYQMVEKKLAGRR